MFTLFLTTVLDEQMGVPVVFEEEDEDADLDEQNQQQQDDEEV